MSQRIHEGVSRPAPVDIYVNGVPVVAYEGESLATALLAAGVQVFSRDSSGRARSPYCNMGVCFDCMVVIQEGTSSRRVRACLTPIVSGLCVVVPESSNE